jgi:L-alanine-DL-glutamate epimerase-like enolase superfamily enzyme
MKITSIEISVFELPMYPATTPIVPYGSPESPRWKPAFPEGGNVPVQVIRVFTDEGIDGTCTVGDWRYTEMGWRELAQLRELAIGEDPLDRDRLHSKLSAAGRFFSSGWFGGFDNCLWDIAGKAAGVPVATLLGGAREKVQAYYNTAGSTADELLRDCELGIEAGFTVLKDHLAFSYEENIRVFDLFRSHVGPEIGLMHDAALANYDFKEALAVGNALQQSDFIWFEEPINDRDHQNNITLCDQLDIPIAGAETLMHEPDLGKLWLKTGAVDILRVNARHGTTPLVQTAEYAAKLGANVEPNSYGPLFGLVHAHTNCGVENIAWFENAPPSNGAEMGEEIGLMNPIRPTNGWVTYPQSPGWGAEWDWKRFEQKRIAVL